MKRIILSVLLLAGILTGAESQAWGPWGPGPYWHHGWCGPGPYWHGGWGPGGRAAFWTGFGLDCASLALGTAALYANSNNTTYVYPSAGYAAPVYPAPLYASPVVVQPQPQVIVQQPSPVVVQQQAAPVVQQQAAPAVQQQAYAQAPQQEQQAPPQQAPQAPTQIIIQNYNEPTPYPKAKYVLPMMAEANPAVPEMVSYAQIQKSNGCAIIVPLQRKGNGWVGPSGETYDVYPTVDQLKARY